MIGGVGNIGKITELRQRILFTFALLAVYRIGAFIVTPGIDPEAEIYWGGPVQPQTGWVLFEADAAAAEDDDEDVREVVPGIGFAGSLSVLRRMASEPPNRLRILLGYAGWGPGQLETELAQGAWLVAPADPAVLFGTELDSMWGRVVRSLGIEPATLVASPGTYDQKHVARIAGVTHCVAYGPGELAIAHQPDEYCGVDDIVSCTKVLALAVMALTA